MVFSSENDHLLCLNALKPGCDFYCFEPRTGVGMWQAHYRVLNGLCFLDILPPSLLRNHYLLFELKCQLSNVTKRQLLLLLSWVSLCLHRWFFTARWRTCDCGAAQAGANGVNFDFFESKIQDKIQNSRSNPRRIGELLWSSGSRMAYVPRDRWVRR